MNKKYADSFPVNARITVDYTKPNKLVSFEYPLEQSIKKWILSFIFPTVALIWLFVILFVICIDVLLSLDSTSLPEKGIVIKTLLRLILSTCLTFVIVFPIPFLISCYIGYNYDKFKYWFPKFQAFLFARGRTHKFSIDKLETCVFEIPLFSNVILTYEATEQFSEFLKRVEIREHNFQFGKEKTQWLWKARFVFSDIPRSGTLKGEFK